MHIGGRRMDDLISRQKAIKAILGEPPEVNYPIYYAEKIRGLPSVQPERKRGKWIRTRTLTHDGELYCDQCEQEHPEQKIIWNFCPNCGCRMEEGE